jgi:hypothetical protein
LIVSKDEKLHIVLRRRFDEDVRRHFIGIVQEAEGATVRFEGYLFVFDTSTNEFVKRPDKRYSIFDLAAEGYLVSILPDSVILDELMYKVNSKGTLVCTDDKSVSLEISEFGARR